MAKRQIGFTLAEVLITLLVVGIVGAAAIPTMTKRSTGIDKSWEWADYPIGSAYSLGTHVLLDKNGNDIPEGINYFPDANIDAISLSNIKSHSEPMHDKLILFNNLDGDDIPETINNFAKPFINFYNTNAQNSTMEYAGSLKADRYNLALGVGALPRLQSNTSGYGLYNTAIGHYALFNALDNSNNTALGGLALTSLGTYGGSQKSGNVAIGVKAQYKNRGGSDNTAVGYNSLNSALSSYNLALGAEALSSDYKYYFYSGGQNIGIGYRAGFQSYDLAWQPQYVEEEESDYTKMPPANLTYSSNWRMRKASDTTYTTKMAGNMFVASATTIPLIQAYAPDWKSKDFNINADELIVNTADGKHTILKVRMIDDEGVALPVLSQTGYGELNYCKGEGSEDVTKANTDPTALADVCIAKFSNIKVVKYAEYTLPTDGNKFIQFINTILENGKYAVRGAQEDTYADWDIFIKRLNVGASGYTSTGLNDPVYIQTVKASLNYLDTWKEGMGIASAAIQAFKNNFLCFFKFLKADCGTGLDEPMTLDQWWNNKMDEIRNSIKEIFSDKRLKNIAGKSTANLDEINALKIKNYTFKNDKTPHVGVIAQELQKVFPNSVVEGADGYLRIKKEEMFFAMVNSIKELDKQSAQLKKDIPNVNKKIKLTVDKNKKLLDKNEKLKMENEKLMAQLKELNDK